MSHTHEADDAAWGLPPEPLYAAAVLAPWAVLSLFLPPTHLAPSLGLLALLGVLLAVAGAWARRRARDEGLDEHFWAFASVASLGYANLVLLVWRPRPGEVHPAWLCRECGRAGAAHEPFCFGCGSTG